MSALQEGWTNPEASPFRHFSDQPQDSSILIWTTWQGLRIRRPPIPVNVVATALGPGESSSGPEESGRAQLARFCPGSFQKVERVHRHDRPNAKCRCFCYR